MVKPLSPGYTVITGETGTGKTGLLLSMLKEDLVRGRGSALLDLKGEVFEIALYLFATDPEWKKLYEKNAPRIWLINPVAHCGAIAAYNALEPAGKLFDAKVDSVGMVADAVTSFIKAQAGWGDLGAAKRLEAVMRASVGLLMSAPGYTLAELVHLFTPTYDANGELELHNPFTKRLLSQCQHLGVRSFWEDTWAIWSASDRRGNVESSLNQIAQYMGNERVLFSCCSSAHVTIDFERIVANDEILLANFPYKYLHTNTSLLADLTAERILDACARRTSGGPFWLRIDEAKEAKYAPLARLVETARYLNLFLCLSVQSLAQLDRGTDHSLRDTVINNARYVYAFRSWDDKELLAEMFFPVTGTFRQNLILPVMSTTAEVNYHQREIANLPPRFVYFYDRHTNALIPKWTPDIPFPTCSRVERARVASRFEGKAMSDQAVPDAVIRAEIEGRRAKIKAELYPERNRESFRPRLKGAKK